MHQLVVFMVISSTTGGPAPFLILRMCTGSSQSQGVNGLTPSQGFLYRHLKISMIDLFSISEIIASLD